METCPRKTISLQNSQWHHSTKQHAAPVLRIAYELCKTAHPERRIWGSYRTEELSKRTLEASDHLRCLFMTWLRVTNNTA